MSVIDRFEELYQALDANTLSKLHEVYSQDVVFIDPVTRHEGLDALVGYFRAILDNTESCKSTINELIGDGDTYMVQWTMTLHHPRLSKDGPIVFDGATKLKVKDDRIVLHRDYFDMGQMIYEHIPLLGRAVKYIKRGLAK